MTNEPLLTQDGLRQLLNYDPDMGAFTWRQGRGPVRAGGVAGCLTRKGYRRIQIDGQNYMAHRLAWLYMYGSWPPEQIDHINEIKSDNRLDNLRLANQTLSLIHI